MVRARFIWPGLDWVGVGSSESVMFRHKCLELMSKFVKDAVVGRCQLWSISSERTHLCA